jgi:hypothetical protein
VRAAVYDGEHGDSCPDCGVSRGFVHHEYCAMDYCTKCDMQMTDAR